MSHRARGTVCLALLLAGAGPGLAWARPVPADATAGAQGTTAAAAPRDSDAARAPAAEDWPVHHRWRDAGGERRTARFVLDRAAVEAALATPAQLDLAAVQRHTAAAVSAAFADHPGGQVVATAAGGTVHIRAEAVSPAAAAALLAEARALEAATTAATLAAAGWRLRPGGSVAPDHIHHVVAAAPQLAPAVAALGGPGRRPRAFAERALGYVQTRSYDTPAGDAGIDVDRYRPPLAVIAEDRGDCDAKSTLMLGLMRSAWPDLPLALVELDGHALVALGLPPRPGDATLQAGGRTWVLAEPVGPAVVPVGRIAPETAQQLTGAVSLSSVPPG